MNLETAKVYFVIATVLYMALKSFLNLKDGFVQGNIKCWAEVTITWYICIWGAGILFHHYAIK